MLNLKIQRKWQFQVGVAMVIMPFLYLVYDTSKNFNAENKVVLQELVASQFNISYRIVPIQIIGIILIILTICGVFEKNKIFNKKHNN